MRNLNNSNNKVEDYLEEAHGQITLVQDYSIPTTNNNNNNSQEHYLEGDSHNNSNNSLQPAYLVLNNNLNNQVDGLIQQVHKANNKLGVDLANSLNNSLLLRHQDLVS